MDYESRICKKCLKNPDENIDSHIVDLINETVGGAELALHIMCDRLLLIVGSDCTKDYLKEDIDTRVNAIIKGTIKLSNEIAKIRDVQSND